MKKKFLNTDVLTAAKERIQFIFDSVENIYISFSGGKDSSVMLHLVMEEAIKRQKKIGVLFIDWEAQYKLTISYVKQCFDLYKDNIEPFWVTLPLRTTNAVSQFEPEWICWESGKNWVREFPEWETIRDYSYFPFYNYAMTFEEFIVEFGKWYAGGELTAGFVGIRADESLHRYYTIIQENKKRFKNKQYTTMVGNGSFNVYPIYDWKVKDIWRYNGKFFKPYNHLYDLFHKAGLSLSQMRICEPYGDEQRKGLDLYHIIEPETWGKLIARVNGANFGSIYANETGNILGNNKVTKPDHLTWEDFANLLLNTMPKKTSEHYRNKIAVYLNFCITKSGYEKNIPDETIGDTGSKDIPSWRRICKVLLKNDYWCKGLSFGPTKTSNYNKYCELMKNRRRKWGIYN